MLKKLTLAAIALLVAVPSLRAADDLSGKWAGKFAITRPDGQVSDDVAYAVITHKGTDLTGTIGPNSGEQWPISKGKVEETKTGVKITFEVIHPQGNGTANFELSVVKGHLVGKAAISGGGGESLSAAVDHERVK
jgi:hypothetical protein